VRAINLRAGDEVADFDLLNAKNMTSANSFLVLVTNKGFGKRLDINSFKLHQRGAKGVRVFNNKGKLKDHLSSALRRCQENDELIISTAKGNVIRQSVNEITLQRRTSGGVRVQNIGEDDEVAGVDVVPGGHHSSSTSSTSSFPSAPLSE
jgi:DNA gyrase subunit A